MQINDKNGLNSVYFNTCTNCIVHLRGDMNLSIRIFGESKPIPVAFSIALDGLKSLHLWCLEEHQVEKLTNYLSNYTIEYCMCCGRQGVGWMLT